MNNANRSVPFRPSPVVMQPLYSRTDSVPTISSDMSGEIHPDIAERLEFPAPTTFNPVETIRVSQEAPWDQSGEDILRNWMATAQQQAHTHRKRGYKLKRLYKFFGVMSVISAAVVFLFSNANIFKDDKTGTIAKVVVAFINLVISNMASFLDYGPKYKHQFEFEGRYSKFAIDIQEILAIDSEYRSPKDRTLAEYKEKIGNLVTNAPET